MTEWQPDLEVLKRIGLRSRQGSTVPADLVTDTLNESWMARELGRLVGAGLIAEAPRDEPGYIITSEGAAHLRQRGL